MFNKLFMNKVWTASALFAISLALYGIDFSMFGSLREISASFLGNLAFLPIYIIVVTLLFERVLKERERQSVMRKLNMVIGVFFSEFGNRLLKELSEHVVGSEELTTRWKTRICLSMKILLTFSGRRFIPLKSLRPGSRSIVFHRATKNTSTAT